MKNIIENDTELGEYGDYCGPGIFVSLTLITLSIVVIGYCVIELMQMVAK